LLWNAVCKQQNTNCGDERESKNNSSAHNRFSFVNDRQRVGLKCFQAKAAIHRSLAGWRQTAAEALKIRL